MQYAQFRFIGRRARVLALGGLLGVMFSCAAFADKVGEPEKDELTFGFIKLTDMAPLAVAYENGYFEDEGLYVTLQAQANWKVLLDGVIDGQLDGAHMLAGQPLGATAGGFLDPAPAGKPVGAEVRSSLGFVLFDRQGFKSVSGHDDGDWQTQPAAGPSDSVFGSPEEQWIDDNSVPLLINRYNGTLIRAE